MSEPSAWIAVGISIVAVVTSLFAIIVSSRASGRSNDLQERLLRLEHVRERDRRIAGKRASIVAFMAGTASNQRLFFRNEGEGVARGIEIRVDGQTVEDYSYIIAPDRPIATLGSKAEASIIVANQFGAPDGIHVTVTWEDDSEVAGRWESDLSF
jgi:hypothetical protein